jgi:hydroxymethylbilane synthase
MSKTLILGTRGSKLALVQAEHVAALLRQHHPDLTVELRIISTTGDRVLDVALSKVGDKGLFVKEIELALLNGEIDLAVHSGKDLPSVLLDGLTLAAFPERADPRDALVLPHRPNAETLPPIDSLNILRPGAIVGTSSLRRASQLRAVRPDLDLRDVRGNVDTRLRKLDEGQYDALLLACAGLDRLGLSIRISLRITPDVLLPAVSQGAIAIEARSDDQRTLELLAPLNHPSTQIAVLAERAFLRHLEGGCQVPIAAHAEVRPETGGFRLRGLVSSLDGRTIVRGERLGSIAHAEETGLELAAELVRGGAAEILAAQRSDEVSDA